MTSAVGKWFVMMYSQSGEHVMPLVDDEGDPMLWETEGAANDAAQSHAHCSQRLARSPYLGVRLGGSFCHRRIKQHHIFFLTA